MNDVSWLLRRVKADPTCLASCLGKTSGIGDFEGPSAGGPRCLSPRLGTDGAVLLFPERCLALVMGFWSFVLTAGRPSLYGPLAYTSL